MLWPLWRSAHAHLLAAGRLPGYGCWWLRLPDLPGKFAFSLEAMRICSPQSPGRGRRRQPQSPGHLLPARPRPGPCSPARPAPPPAPLRLPHTHALSGLFPPAGAQTPAPLLSMLISLEVSDSSPREQRPRLCPVVSPNPWSPMDGGPESSKRQARLPGRSPLHLPPGGCCPILARPPGQHRPSPPVENLREDGVLPFVPSFSR